MTIFDEIERDAKAGTQGRWGLTNADVTFSVRGGEGYSTNHICEMNHYREDRGPEREPNARRIANVPRYERAIMAAKELAETLNDFIIETVDYMDRNNLGDPEQQHNVKRGRAALAAFREATK